MSQPADFAQNDTNKDYCVHCSNQDGTMKSYEQVLEGSIHWGMENFTVMGFETKPQESEMRNALIAHMANLPAWKK
jgi:hypothetical protein